MFVTTRIIFSYFQRESLSPVESAGPKKKKQQSLLMARYLLKGDSYP